MPPKAVLVVSVLTATVIISGPSGTQSNTSIVKLSKQSVKWYKEIIT